MKKFLFCLCRFKTDRSFVVRGSRVGVFKQKDSKLNFVTSIKNIKDPSTKEIFSPKKIMLHEADRSLLMLHPNNSSSVFNMDLERGQVIEEWVSVCSTFNGDVVSDLTRLCAENGRSSHSTATA
jgi:hypothetical protein